LSAGQLHRLWQLLLKGHDEVRLAPDPLASAQMALLRVMHAADLPDPGKLARKLEEAAANAGAFMATMPAGSGPGPAAIAVDWGSLCSRIEDSGQLRIAQIMRDWVRVVDLKPLSLTFMLVDGYPGDPTAELRDALLRATGERWEVTRAAGNVEDALLPSLREQADARRAAEDVAMRASPLVVAALAAFPEAEFVEEKAGQEPPRNRSRFA
jgi:DNA polymerase-3 subunit gamma/tau